MPPKPSFVVKDCCVAEPGKGDKVCVRKEDQRLFDIEKRKVPKDKCTATPAPKGFTARASCAPYKGCDREPAKK